MPVTRLGLTAEARRRRLPKRPPASDPLATYRAKRSLERTPEPAGAVTRTDGRLFVVHEHAARRLHWDLRLEMDGVLRSWAVPKGPSYDTADKRLAVLVEDHPLEYGDFEGLIPDGNYGAGAVIVWDRGEWVPIGDPLEGLAKGKLLFELRGYKLHGLWTLVKLKKGEKDWLLIKERDDWASAERLSPAESVLSGLTVEDLKSGQDRGEEIRKELTRLGAPKRPVDTKAVGLMLAETAERHSRARAGCSSPSSTATGCSPRAAPATRGSSPATATTAPRRFPRLPARSPRCRSTACCSMAKWWRSTTAGSRASSGCRAARGFAGRSTSGTRPSRTPSPTTPSTCSASRTSTSGRSRSRPGRRCFSG